MKTLGIDASNIRAGGGVTHLVEVLSAASPESYGFTKVIVWGSQYLGRKLPTRDWLIFDYQPALEKNPFKRLCWKKFKLTQLAKQYCDILFIPGGLYMGAFRPFVTISQNLLPFDKKELRQYRYSLAWLKFLLLSFGQRITFNKAKHVIFLTDYAKLFILRNTRIQPKYCSTIAHGIHPRFLQQPRKNSSQFSAEKPFRLLYVSTIHWYKHQWYVVEAVRLLREMNLPITIDFIGSGYQPAIDFFLAKLDEIDEKRDFIKYHGNVGHKEIASYYKNADAFVFASSSETFGIILLEAMASGLPIACSNLSSMPETLADGGLYFNPRDPDDIASAIEKLFNDVTLREKLANKAYNRAKHYSWKKCADETFQVIASSLQN